MSTVVFIDPADDFAAARAANPDAPICVREPPPKGWSVYFPGRDDKPIAIPNGGFNQPLYAGK